MTRYSDSSVFKRSRRYDDYGRHATEIAEHVYCRRIAGDASTPPPFAVAIPSPARFGAEVLSCLPEAGCGYSCPLSESALPDHATTVQAFRRRGIAFFNVGWDQLASSAGPFSKRTSVKHQMMFIDQG